ncbi:DEAD/DEAH box helicase [Flavobacteriaceae bacterium KMM 6898]|nr:DEAD/DEAH box helicase [Flavobacteriaceae bacterium KMM 6898]
MNHKKALTHSLRTGFIDHHFQSNIEYRPKIINNAHKQGKKVLTTIIRELETCEEFWFSVAFITTGGLATLINTIKELEKQNIKGRILASQYLNFTQPEALKRIKQFNNIELRIATEGSFHSKGYLFKKNGFHNLIIGSSNLTQTALCTNKEWNLKITAADGSELINQAVNEFKKEFAAAQDVTETYLLEYSAIWQAKMAFEREINAKRKAFEKAEIKPNLMQCEALENIEYLRSQDKTKALLISATGTGKTYLSAFDVQKFKPKKFLFIVHRRTIAEEAMKTFKSLLGDEISMGLYSGIQREIKADYIFSTVQTISKPDHLEMFDSDHFDYIVIDETHRAGANSYVRIMEHFTPKFLLGMTATPERSDGMDIFKIFDYNIAYEIRLHRALSEEMLSPFHYYGVTDLTVDNEEVDDLTDFNKLTAKERVDRILETAESFGCDNGNIRGLIFCSRNEISIELSKEFNCKGYKTLALTGNCSEDERQNAISRLESELESEKLDYIFTVDIFNEGIDIPRVNQIIMLRPTQSAIIFVQQLGRGLRKREDKDYLTVIDFIGNYSNNYLVPIALYGDTSYNKDTLRKMMTSGSSLMPGTSTINFDPISKEKIFASINQASMQTKRELVHDYNLLKNQIGRIPMMLDFLKHGSRDPWLFIKKYKSYYNFVQSIESKSQDILNKETVILLELFGLEINNGKRVEEAFILKHLILNQSYSIEGFKSDIKTTYQYDVSEATIASCINNLNFIFIRKNYDIVKFVDGYFVLGTALSKLLAFHIAKEFLLDNTLYSIEEFTKNYSRENFYKGLIINNKYSRKDVCRILNWPLDNSSTVYGYRTNNNITPCFVTYHKSDDITESTMYNDHFIDQQTFAWESRSNRRLESSEIQSVINSERILLFIKKEDGEGSDFYYLGDVNIIEDGVEQSKMKKSAQPVVHFKYKLQRPVEDGLYNYMIK